MKHIFKILFLFLPVLAHSQGGTWPVKYNDSDPSGAPSAAGTRLYFNTATNTLFTWEPAPSSTWRKQPKAFDQVSGCAAPAYTPTARQSTFAVNSCTPPELYQYTGSAWECLNCVEGLNLTAGAGIALAGTAPDITISNSAPDQTVTMTDGAGIDVTGTYPNFTVTNTAPNVVQTLSIAGQDLTLSGGGGTVEIPAGADSTFAKTSGSYLNKRIADNIYKNGTLGLRDTDTTAIFNIKTDANALSADQKNVIHISHTQSSLTDNPERSHVWSIYDPNGLTGNIPTNKKFGRWYDYTTYYPNLNTPADPADTTGDMVHIMGYNLGRSDNNLRGSTWMQFEQDFNQPGSPHALKDLMEFHLNHLFLNGTVFRSINANATTDGTFIETSLGGDVIKFQSARGLIDPVMNWDNRTRYLQIFDTTEIYFQNNLPGAIIEKYKTSTTLPMIVLSQNSDNSIQVGDINGIRVLDTLQIKYAGSQNGGTFTATGANNLQLNSNLKLKTGIDRMLSFERTGITSPNDWYIEVGSADIWALKNSASVAPLQLYDNATNELLTLRSGSVSIGQAFSIPTRFSIFQNANSQGGGLSLINSGNTKQVYFYIENDYANIKSASSNKTIASLSLINTTTGTKLFVSDTSPEATITGSPGDICFADDGNLYIKKTGTGNTGWKGAVTTDGSAASAALEITSTTQGVLFPRMTTAQRDAIVSPATALTLYCTDCTATDASTGVMQVYNGTTWKNAW